MQCSETRRHNSNLMGWLQAGVFLLLVVLQWLTVGCGGGCGHPKTSFNQEVETPYVLSTEDLASSTTISMEQPSRHPTEQADESTGCVISSDCDDGDMCTEDRCVSAICRSIDIPSSACCAEQSPFLMDFDVTSPSNFLEFDVPLHGVGWQVSSQRALSAPHSLYFGNPETQNYGALASVKGEAIMGPIDVPGTGEPELRLAVAALISPHPGYDLFTVSAELLNEQAEVIGQVGLLEKSDLPGSVYSGFSWVLLPIPSLKGKKVRLRFSFHSLIVPLEANEGIYIDDVEIAIRCPSLTICDHDLDCDDDDICTLDVCSAAGCVHDPLCDLEAENDETTYAFRDSSQSHERPGADGSGPDTDSEGSQRDEGRSSFRADGIDRSGTKHRGEDSDADIQRTSSKRPRADDTGESRPNTGSNTLPSAKDDTMEEGQAAQSGDGDSNPDRTEKGHQGKSKDLYEDKSDEATATDAGKGDGQGGRAGQTNDSNSSSSNFSDDSDSENGEEFGGDDESITDEKGDNGKDPCSGSAASMDCCTSDMDCQDGLTWTIDVCEGATCVSTPNPDACGSDSDCEDGESCTIDRCEQGLCLYEGVFGSICCQSNDEALFDFDLASLAGLFVTDNTESGVFWSVDKTRASSGQFSLYCGDPVTQTYQTGVRVKSSATTPIIEVSAGGLSYVVFDLYKDTRHQADYDVLQVFVLRDGALLPAWSSKTLTGGVTDSDFHTVVVPLQDYAGQLIQLRFVFDSVDGSSGAYEGAYIDTIRLKTECD